MSTYVFFILIILQIDGYISSTDIKVESVEQCHAYAKIYKSDFDILNKAIIVRRSAPGYVYDPKDDRARLLYLGCEIRRYNRT